MIRSLLICLCCASVWMPRTIFAQEPSESVLHNFIQHATGKNNTHAAWTFQPADYQHEVQDLPIGVFDSGIGGLTVLEAILSLDAFNNETAAPGADGKPDFQNERFIYFGDQANMPYGNYAAAGKLDYLRELILKDAVFLLGKRYWKSSSDSQPALSKPPVKAIAIGCNTATAYGLEDIQAALKSWDIPIDVVGVVNAGARGVLEAQPREQATEERRQSIAVLATIGTCNSQAYPKAIGRTLGQAGRRIPDIVQHGFADLAAAIEGDPTVLENNSVDEIIHDDLQSLLENYRQQGHTSPIGSIVLGCTHFPLVKDRILREFEQLRNAQVEGRQPYRSLISDRIEVVDPAELTAKELFRSLVRTRRRASAIDSQPQGKQGNLFFISIPNSRSPGVELAEDGGFTKEHKYGRQPLNLELEDTLVVPMRPDQLPAASLQLIQSRLPSVWKSLNASDGPSTGTVSDIAPGR